MRVYEQGGGALTVVVAHGAGDCASSWAPVVQRITGFARVVTYDRAGLGGSQVGPPATLGRYLAELRAVIQATAWPGPVLLVGHSLGGLLVRMYARQHPGEVAGLVLVDATPGAVAGDPGVKAGFFVSGILASLLKALSPFGLVRALLALRAMPLYPEQRQYRAAVSTQEYRRWVADVCAGFARAAGQELRSVLAVAAAAEQDADADAGLVGMPVAVLTSHAWGEKWVAMHREVVAALGARDHRVTDDGSHNIHLRHPDLVADAVLRVLDAARLA